jgi:ATP-binding cassette subfamily B protein
MLCITHDVAETLNFPRVLVIEGGQIVEDGSPTTLAATDSRYRALLAAEARVQHETWGGTLWRRLRLTAGTLVELPAESDGENR